MEQASIDQIKRMETLLADLLARAEASAVFLCDRGGNIIAEHSARKVPDEDNIIALAAGSFFATRELARLLGEPEFRCVFHQGAKTSLFMQSTTATDLVLLVVFGQESNPGLVKLYASESCKSIDKHYNTKTAAAPASQSMRFEVDPGKQLFKMAARVPVAAP